ncbi:hypothetical protein K402DRAFT_415902 [Aulographum hederae CBS 113979]|uniref:AAA+ ATPase domain-containing protein n=1 Tax=Aulographum hederae CBS 113979 TaxID=1176131 RepID=A0A6G1HGL5_9PEZI|nr:hypothetical protein K402DRAFT_415902 [Aulographum hederae CBS 113979]
MNKQARTNRSPSPKTSPRQADTVLTPSSTPSETPQRSSTSQLELDQLLKNKMETAREDKSKEDVDVKQGEQSSSGADNTGKEASPASKPGKKSKKSCKKSTQKKKKSSKKAKKEESSDSSDSESDASESDSSDSSSSSSEDEKQKRKARSKRKALKKKAKARKHKKSKRHETSSSDSDSDSDTDSDESEVVVRRRKSRRAVVTESEPEEEEDTPAVDLEAEATRIQEELNALHFSIAQQRSTAARTRAAQLQEQGQEHTTSKKSRKSKRKSSKAEKSEKPRKRASMLEYKRVDQLWDSTIHNYKLTESAEDQEDEFDAYIFTVRRKFDWENKYRNTVVDIKSKFLKEALAEVMKDVKGVSLVEEQPCVDPNMLFLYLEEIRTHYKKTLKSRLKKEKKKKVQKRVKQMIAHCKVLVSYIDEDYDETKKTLYPLLEAGNITFDLLWALFKPNSLAYTTTYGSSDDPRCFKVDYANKESSFIKGEWYSIEGRYLEYDGKNFGLGDFEMQVESFKGPRKITGLSTYPMKYHKDPEGIRKQLIERGRQFVAMQGMNYRFHKGLAFQKKKKAVAKVNINGRIMIDPAIFRRINPNYPISSIKPKDQDDLFSDDDDGSGCSSCGCGSSDEDDAPDGDLDGEKDEGEKTKYKLVLDKDDKPRLVEVPVDENGQEVHQENLDKIDGEHKTMSFSDEELLIASPVVVGFSFSEKLWLEFSLSGVRDIEWNNGAFESLVLPHNQKSIVQALVSTHKFHAAETIDDVVQGKGKGLVFVLHGPPGVGKTLTGEGIAEFLKCPLYAVSAGELGTETSRLEHELQKIMDIAHSWGAVLLLDEADVFLEKREVHDIHRNALVSIFLRLLEYFQGILFLTTNRVETFDDAFQSRIHVALRYEQLSPKAKKEIWKMFLEKVRVMEKVETAPFKETDFDMLARNNLNGRQIKNVVRTAQALAVNEKQALSLEHIKRVLEVAESFDRDLKGGTGYMDAMRSYT